MNLYSNQKYLEGSDFLFHAELRTVTGSIMPHSHEFIELVYIGEGKGLHEHNGSTYEVGQGEVFIIEPGVEHAYTVKSGNRLSVYNVLFQPAVFTKELALLSQSTSFVDFFYVEPFLRQSVGFQSRLTLTVSQQLEANLLFERLVKEYRSKDMGYRFLIKTKLIEIFIYLSRFYAQTQTRPMTIQASEQEVIQRICEFIELHHAQPLALTQVCRICGMSQTKFMEKFREYKGQTFLEFRNAVRIRVAKKLLTEGDKKIIEIAQQVGFDDLSHFNRLFKQSTGLTPGCYRQNHRL